MKLPKLSLRGVPVRRILPWVLVGVLLLTTLVNWRIAENRDNGRQDEITETATEFLHAFTNYRAGTITQDVARMKAFAIGSFRRQLDETFDSDALDRIRRNRAIAAGRIWTVSVPDSEGPTAQARALVYETVNKEGGGGPETDLFQLELAMVKTDDGWKVADVVANILPGSSLAPTPAP